MTYQRFWESYNKLNASYKDLLNELINGLVKIKENELANDLIFEEIIKIKEDNNYTVAQICDLAAAAYPSSTYIDEDAMKKCISRRSTGSAQFPYILDALNLNERYKKIQNDIIEHSILKGDFEWKYSHLNESHQILLYNVMNRLLLIQDGISELDTSFIETELPEML